MFWYSGESFRLLPNIEIWHDEEKEEIVFTFVWMKFSFDLPICIKWRNKK